MNTCIRIAIMAMGFSGLVAEVLLLREFLIVFSGNELCIGIVLANWLILEAVGCYFAGRQAEKAENQIDTFSFLTILFSISLPAAIYLIRILKRISGVSIGESLGLLSMLYSSFLILMPASTLHGALFTCSCRIYSRFSGAETAAAGRVYIYETVGTIIGSIVCTYVFIPYLNTFQAVAILALLNFSSCLVLFVPFRKAGLFPKKILVGLGVLIFFSGYLVFSHQADKLHHYSIKAQWQNHNIVHYQNSQYGNICVIENQGQYIFFLDGIPNIITPIPDIAFVEEFVHLPLLAHPEPKKLLILSGGAGGMIHAVLKHSSIETVEYAELDPLVLELIRKFSTALTESELNDPRVKIKHIDGRLLLKTKQDRYDMILLGIMDPSNLQANRLFTKEFFALVQARLTQGGMLVMGLPGSLTYLNVELKNLNSCIFHTLKSVFAYTRVIPGDGHNLFLSSDSPDISSIDRLQIVQRLIQRGIEAETVMPWHIENKLHPGWQEWFTGFIEGGSQKLNYDFKPLGLFYSLAHWNTLFAPGFHGIYRQFEGISLEILLFLFVLLILLYFLFRSKSKGLSQAGIPFSIAATGFAGMTFNLILIFAFQSIYGYVFSWIGLIIAAFMAGVACGAALITKTSAWLKNCFALYLKIEFTIVGFALVLPFAFLCAHPYWEGRAVFFSFKILFFIMALIGGMLIGSQFPLANKLYLGKGASVSKTAGLLYASDLLGGWLGGIAGAVVLLPVLGLAGTCITVALLKLTSFIVIITRPEAYSR